MLKLCAVRRRAIERPCVSPRYRALEKSFGRRGGKSLNKAVIGMRQMEGHEMWRLTTPLAELVAHLRERSDHQREAFLVQQPCLEGQPDCRPKGMPGSRRAAMARSRYPRSEEEGTSGANAASGVAEAISIRLFCRVRQPHLCRATPQACDCQMAPQLRDHGCK